MFIPAFIAIIDTRPLEQLAYLVRNAIKEETYFVCPNRKFIQRYDTREPALFFDFGAAVIFLRIESIKFVQKFQLTK